MSKGWVVFTGAAKKISQAIGTTHEEHPRWQELLKTWAVYAAHVGRLQGASGQGLADLLPVARQLDAAVCRTEAEVTRLLTEVGL